MIIVLIIILIILFVIYKYNQKPKIREHITQLDENKKYLKYTDSKNVYEIYKMTYITDKILRKHKITYFIIGGTLLGSIRHDGMIPWDDDADFFIFEKDEKKLLTLKKIFSDKGYILMKTWFGIKVYPKKGKSIKGFRWKFPALDLFVARNIKSNNIEPIIYKYPKAEQTFYKSRFYSNELFPLKEYKFGNYSLLGPQNPEPYLIRSYGTDWASVAYMQYDHENEHRLYKKRVILNDENKKPAQPFFIK